MAEGAADAGAWVVCVSGVEDWVVVVAVPDLVVATGFALFEATVFTFAVSAFPEGDEADAVDFEDFFNMGDVAEVEEDAKITVDETAPTEIQNNDIQSILEDYNQAKSDISKKSSKFVEKGDQSLLDEINDIHDEPGC